jgi:hypothetical protein
MTIAAVGSVILAVWAFAAARHPQLRLDMRWGRRDGGAVPISPFGWTVIAVCASIWALVFVAEAASQNVLREMAAGLVPFTVLLFVVALYRDTRRT